MSLIEQYTAEIASMERSLEACKRELDYYTEQKRIHRPTARGRIANDNWNARLGNATYDLRIAACRAKIAMYKNQIALRKAAIKEEQKKAKTVAKAKPTAKPMPVTTKQTTSAQPAAKKTATKPTTKAAISKPVVKKTTAKSAVKKNTDGSVDKRIKEGKAIVARMAKARAAIKKKK